VPDYGRERARQHIEDAQHLSRELGGMDEDVKRYFFALSSSQLEEVLKDYGARYGSSAQRYAANTIEKWRSGAVYMSGTVAERLFKLLPPRMPLAVKYQLTEGLWKHVGPSSKKTIRVGLNATIGEIIQVTWSHIEEVVVQYRIPEQLEKRFTWLSSGDVLVKQDLLNHLRQMEKELVVRAAQKKMPILMEHLRADFSGYTTRLAQVLTVGKHELELLLDRHASGARLEAWSPPTIAKISPSNARSLAWLWWIIGIFVAIAVLHMISRHG
jgi:hypothetical protein